MAMCHIHGAYMKSLAFHQLVNLVEEFAKTHKLTWSYNEPLVSIFNLFHGEGWFGKLLVTKLATDMSSADFLQHVDQLLFSIPELAKSIPFISQVVKHQPEFINKFPDFKKNEDVLLSIFAYHPEHILLYPEWHSVKMLKKAIHYNPLVYRYIPYEFKHNKQLAKLALCGSILYQKEETDKRVGTFFDMPQVFQQNENMILLAVKNYPYLFKLLPKLYQEQDKVVLEALNAVFYDKFVSKYHHITNIIPYISDNFFKNSQNILWVMNAFEENISEVCSDINNSMSSFDAFLVKACDLNQDFRLFADTLQLRNYFCELLKIHSIKMYQLDLIPTGLEIDAINFFKTKLVNFRKNFDNFMFYLHLEDIVLVKPPSGKKFLKI